jgi:hypothetical protein
MDLMSVKPGMGAKQQMRNDSEAAKCMFKQHEKEYAPLACVIGTVIGPYGQGQTNVAHDNAEEGKAGLMT